MYEWKEYPLYHLGYQGARAWDNGKRKWQQIVKNHFSLGKRLANLNPEFAPEQTSVLTTNYQIE